MNENAGKFAGMTREACREAVVEELKKLGLLVKVEPLKHNVGTCYRCHDNVEPLVSTQWFVKMKPLAEPAIEVAKNKELVFVPERFEKTYLNWMENIRDWCISRQLWWGHRIPAFYCEQCGEITVSREDITACPKCGGHVHQDEDVLDTWFSSALWPFSTLGWPEETEDLKYFYPNSVLSCGYDIIFFWLARMVFSGIEQMGKCPFHVALMHGLVRDAQGQEDEQIPRQRHRPHRRHRQVRRGRAALLLGDGRLPGRGRAHVGGEDRVLPQLRQQDLERLALRFDEPRGLHARGRAQRGRTGTVRQVDTHQVPGDRARDHGRSGKVRARPRRYQALRLYVE